MLLHTGGSWNIIQNMTKQKVVDNFFLHHWAVAVQGHNYITRLLTYSYTVLLCSRCKIHRYVAVLHGKGNFWDIGRNFLPGRKPDIGWNHHGMTKKVETHLFILYSRGKVICEEMFLPIWRNLQISSKMWDSCFSYMTLHPILSKLRFLFYKFTL